MVGEFLKIFIEVRLQRLKNKIYVTEEDNKGTFL